RPRLHRSGTSQIVHYDGLMDLLCQKSSARTQSLLNEFAKNCRMFDLRNDAGCWPIGAWQQVGAGPPPPRGGSWQPELSLQAVRPAGCCWPSALQPVTCRTSYRVPACAASYRSCGVTDVAKPRPAAHRPATPQQQRLPLFGSDVPQLDARAVLNWQAPWLKLDAADDLAETEACAGDFLDQLERQTGQTGSTAPIDVFVVASSDSRLARRAGFTNGLRRVWSPESAQCLAQATVDQEDEKEASSSEFFVDEALDAAILAEQCCSRRGTDSSTLSVLRLYRCSDFSDLPTAGLAYRKLGQQTRVALEHSELSLPASTAPPEMSRLQYEPSSGLYYDPVTGLYYSSSSRLFYDASNCRYLFWDDSTHETPVGPHSAAAAARASLDAFSGVGPARRRVFERRLRRRRRRWRRRGGGRWRRTLRRSAAAGVALRNAFQPAVVVQQKRRPLLDGSLPGGPFPLLLPPGSMSSRMPRTRPTIRSTAA
uniref:OCRE domain-containing protein n=1 Tax=Macrostomum lignano TaxID=282301 RepID=A0A1I8FQG5_9PLAT